MTDHPTQINDSRHEDGSVDIQKLAGVLLVTPHELALAAGLTETELSESTKVASASARVKLDAFLNILEQVTPWSGDLKSAFSWYRSQPLPSFGHMTAEDLVKAGRTTSLRSYLARVDSGGNT